MLLAGLLLPALALAAEAPVNLTPNYGEYREEHEDLSVKVQGGHIKIFRSWSGRQWHINQHWNALQFVSRNGIVYGISRNNYVYRQLGSSTWVDERDANKRISKTAGGYRWTNRSGDFIDYDNSLRMIAYGDRNNNTVTLSYNVDGRLSGVAGPDAVQEIWFDYTLDGSNNVTTLVIRDGPLVDANTRKVTYSYNATGQLTQVTDVRGYNWGYTYTGTAPGALIATALDPENRATTITYAGVAVASITDATGITTRYRYEYDKTRRQYYRREKTAGGRITETWFDSKGRIIRVDVNGINERTIVIDTSTNTRTETNAAKHKTIRKYDQWDNVTGVTYPDGSKRTTTYQAAANRVRLAVNELGIQTNYDYDAKGNLIKVTEAWGKPEQRITDFTYDAFGNLLTITRQADAKTVAATTTFTYGAKGNLASVTDAENQVVFTAVAYSKAGQLLEWKDGRNLIWKQTFDGQGNLLSRTNPLNETVSLEYDSTGNLVKQTAPDSTFSQITYDAEGRPTEMIDSLLASTKIGYNAAGLMVQVTDAEKRVVQSLTYDLYERPIETSDGAGNTITYEYGGENVLPTELAAMVNPLSRTEYRYDVFGRPIQITTHPGPNARVSQSRYDALGNLIESTDPNGKITRHTYDVFNRLIQSQDVTTGHTVKYGYDNRDNLLTVTNEKDVIIRTYSYNKNNQKITETWAGGEVFTYAYGANGNLIQKLDAKGLVTRYEYDHAGRLSIIGFYPNLIDPVTKTVNYSYDTKGRFTGYNDGVTSSTITYDDADRKLTETVNFGPFSKTLAYTYYKNGLRKTFTGSDPDGAGPLSGTVASYLYDQANRWLATDLPGEGSFAVNRYNWILPTKITFPGGANQNQQYDAFGQITGTQSKDPAQNPLMDLSYSYDKVGNILSRTSKEGTTHYTYDDRYRLTNVDAPGAADDEAYTYDPAGNRITAHNTMGNWQYNHNNQLLAYENRSFTYDDNGNTLTESDTSTIPATLLNTYVYSQEDRLIEVQDSGAAVIASYDYDPLGRRIKKTTGGVTTYYLYSDDGLVAEFDALGNENQSYGYMPNSPWGTNPLYTKIASGYAYYHNDHLGTPQLMTANSGAKVWEGKMAAFGQMSITIETITNNLRFPGQYSDQETGLHYNFFRNYHPGIGRYRSSDPIGMAGGRNNYAYAGENPLSYIDFDGLAACAPGLKNCFDDPSTETGNTLQFGPNDEAWYDSPQFLADCKVESAYADKEFSDGTKMRFPSYGKKDSVLEQGFSVSADGVLPRPFTKEATRKCTDGTTDVVKVMDFSDLTDAYVGHTHGGWNLVQYPGPEDGEAASLTNRAAYAITRKGAFAIEKTAVGYRIRQLSGPKLKATDRKKLRKIVSKYNLYDGGSGKSCKIIPNSI